MPESSNVAATAALGASRSYQKMMMWVFLAFIADWAIRMGVFATHNGSLVDIASKQAGCGHRDRRLVCSGFVRWWPWVDLIMSLLRILLMLLIPYLVCFVIKDGLLDGVNEDIRKILMLQQVFSFLSSVHFVLCFGLVHDYMGEDERRRLLFVLLASVSVFVFTEIGRRRCDDLYSLNQQLVDRAKARARADLLPQAVFRELRHGSGVVGDTSCAICLADFEDTDVVSRLPCRHGFHTDCIREWLGGGLHCGCPMRCAGAAEATVVGAASSV